ncbi:MAG: diguanylate cyclase [Eubacterium sp.]|nr:diguanylate cyclase [Eubacterium sp.]
MKRNILFSAISLLIAVAIFSVLYFSLKNVNAEGVETFSNGWNAELNGETYTDLSEEEFAGIIMNKFRAGDTITYSNTMGIDLSDADSPTLMIELNRTSAKVYIDGHIINDTATFTSLDTTDGAGFYYFTLPAEDYTDSIITISMTAGEGYISKKPMPIIIGDYYQVLIKFVVDFFYQAMACIFLYTFGGFMVIICLVLYSYYPSIRIILFSGFFMFELGLYSACNYHFTAFFMNLKLTSILEYTTLYAMIGFFYMLLDAHLERKPFRSPLYITGGVILMFSVITALMDLGGILKQIYFLPIFILLFAFGIILLFYTDYKLIIVNKCKPSIALSLISLSILSLLMTVELIITNYFSNTELGTNPVLSRLFPVGAALYVIIQLKNYLTFTTYVDEVKHANDRLSRIAYVDALTGLTNRAGAYFAIAHVKETRVNFCVISLDLNGLKEVNDANGHNAGDRMLRNFAKALQTAFEDIGTCIRIGGDEFVVLIEEPDKEVIEDRLSILNLLLAKLDEQDPEIDHSVAYGYAFKDELDEDIDAFHNTFLLADERMYALKEKQHKAMALRKNRE